MITMMTRATSLPSGKPIRATIVLRAPDGREFTLTDTWSVAYEDTPTGRFDAEDSFEWYWREGNQGCDCNRMLYIERHCGVQLWEGDSDDIPCGDTIELVSFTVERG